MNVALFISGRILGYDTCLIPLVNTFSKDYTIKVFFSINTLSLGEGESMDTIISHLKQLLGDRSTMKNLNYPTSMFIQNSKTALIISSIINYRVFIMISKIYVLLKIINVIITYHLMLYQKYVVI
jgi:hypothetical protein